ncbi:ribonuclease 3-like protein 2 isoform X1 [Typha angustifolia]|uniref:ribonuclease 3-like protein 2 isoform X1 n=1 Tax=Typha angustifolia TaxID=59011 RepID=UPI003C2FD076
MTKPADEPAKPRHLHSRALHGHPRLAADSTHSSSSTSASSMLAAVAAVEQLLDYSFSDPSLLNEALTHSSFSDSQLSYQRLEFLGDAALGLALSNYLYLANPDLGPGPLSDLRAANISTEKLARVAVRHRLYPLLRRNSPSLDNLVNQFTELVMQESEEEFGGLIYGGSTMKAPKVLADVVEAIAAAVYVDCNFNLEILWMVFRGILEPIITPETLNEQPVTMLHELCQKQGKNFMFKNWQKNNVNVFNVFVDGQLVGMGSSEHKMIAKLNAARDALEKLASSKFDFLMTTELLSGDGEAGEQKESKQKLNELCSKMNWPKPIYKVEKEQGPAHGKKFMCSVQVETSDNTFITLGELKSRLKEAENAAAAKMLTQVLVGGDLSL